MRPEYRGVRKEEGEGKGTVGRTVIDWAKQDREKGKSGQKWRERGKIKQRAEMEKSRQRWTNVRGKNRKKLKGFCPFGVLLFGFSWIPARILCVHNNICFLLISFLWVSLNVDPFFSPRGISTE